MKRTTLIATIAGVTLTLVPLAQAQTGFQGSPDAIDRAVVARQAELYSGFNGSPDAVDRAVAARQAELAANFDAREQANLRIGSSADGRQTMPDLVQRTALAHERNTMPDLSSMPDVIERTAAAGELQYQPVTTTASRFDWSDFGIGAGAGGGLMLLLGLGIGLLVVRHGDRRVTTA